VVANFHRKARIDVLLVDDDEEDFLLTKDLLTSIHETRMEVRWAPDSHSALEAARDTAFDVALVDYRLGGEDGIGLVREFVAGGFDMPVIVLTGLGDRAVDIEATEAGAADYLVKGEVGAAMLERTIRYAMRSHADMRALRETEESYRQAQRMEAVGRLAGGVAHDFNNLMSAVVGFSDLVLASLEDDHPQRSYVEDIKRAGERASAMTKQLLAFSRKQVLEPRVLDLNTVVAEVRSLLQRLIGEDVELVSLLDPALQSITADPGQLEQVIMNLAVNARDAMPTGGTLTIETANVSLDADAAGHHMDIGPGEYVLLSVSDTGTGMDDATAKLIFEPFFTTKEEGKGTGLGLATVFGIVKQSGGDITVESAVGRGTRFRVLLPRTDAVPVTRSPSVAPSATIPRGSETILVVEDEELVRHLEREVLTRCGYTVLEASSPSIALEIVRTHGSTIDLLLTDIVMPEMSGYALAGTIAELRKGMRILYASGHSEEWIERHGPIMPAASFIAKPFTPLSLGRKVREVLDEPATGRCADSAA
jgi:signal transduction histidine kinase